MILVVAVVAIAWAPSVLSAQVLDNTQTAYRNTVSTWLGPISAIARRLFVVLAAIEVAVSGTLYALRRDSLDEMASKFLLKFIILSVVLMLITSAGYWLKPIINGLALAGQVGGGGVSNLGPSGIVDMGLRIAWGMIDTTGLPISFASLETAFYALTSRLVITFAFVAVAVMVVLTWVEAYVALAGGVLFLGFGGMRATAQFAENYLAFLFYIGARLFVLYLLLGVGITIMQNQIASMPPAMTPPQMGELLAMSVIFAAITLRVPTSIASRVAGSGSFGIAQALRSL
jgi:type IV secretion system protein TrbL